MNPRLVLFLLALAACGPKTSPESAGGQAPGQTAVQVAPLAGASAIPLEKRIDEAAALLASPSADEGKLQRALQLLQSASKDAPDNPVVHLNLGIAYHRLGDLDAAADAYRVVLAKQPENGAAYLYLAQISRARGDVDGAITQLRRGLAVDGENMDLWAAIVGALHASGRLDEAVAEGKKALAVNANSIDVYTNLGMVYIDQEEYALANFIFQKATMVPGAEDDALLQANLAWTYYLQGDPAKAQVRLEEARKRDPDLVPTLVYLAHIYMDDHNWKDALDALEVAAKQAPSDAAIQLNLGICYRGVGRTDDAKKAYEKALQLEPSNPAPHFNLGILLGDTLKDYDAAISSFKKYVDAGGPDAPLALEYMDEVEKEKKRVEKKKKAEEERKKREQERIERQKLLEAAEKQKAEAEKAAAEAAAKQAAEEAAAPKEAAPEVDELLKAPTEAPPAEEGEPGEEFDTELEAPEGESEETPWGEPQ